MGKTKVLKKIKKSKRKFSRKNRKIRGGAIFNDISKKFLSILLFGIFFYIQCAALNSTYHLQMSIPYMKHLHNWFLLIKNFCTFLDKIYPKNIFTQKLYGGIKYAVQQIPNETARNAIENAIPAVILRPNILKATHKLIEDHFEKSETGNTIIALSKGAEQFSEYMRIFNVDLGALKSADELYHKNEFSVSDYTTLFHVGINYESKFNEITTYINKLLVKIYNEDTKNIEEMFFESVSDLKPIKIITDVHAALNPSELSQEIQNAINNGVNTINKNITSQLKNQNQLNLLLNGV
jgi:hypothetical protein